MKNINLIYITAFIIIFSFFGIKKYLNQDYKKNLRNDEKIFLKESIRILNKCFDLENKNRRSLNQSIELIEYCLDEYGYKK